MTSNQQKTDTDRYLTLGRSCNAVLTVQGSRFIAMVCPASTPEVAKNVLEQVRKKYHDASHHCYAMRIGYADDQIEQSSDAGEPAGTAGRPILEVLQSKGVWDVVGVVTRWFGGTKLGTGGLKRAYHEATEMAVNEVTLISRVVSSVYTLRFEHSLTGVIYRVIGEYDGLVTSTDFGSRVRMEVAVRRGDGRHFHDRLFDAARGLVEIKQSGVSVR